MGRGKQPYEHTAPSRLSRTQDLSYRTKNGEETSEKFIEAKFEARVFLFQK
jgi:hypothetical protein